MKKLLFILSLFVVFSCDKNKQVPLIVKADNTVSFDGKKFNDLDAFDERLHKWFNNEFFGIKKPTIVEYFIEEEALYVHAAKVKNSLLKNRNKLRILIEKADQFKVLTKMPKLNKPDPQEEELRNQLHLHISNEGVALVENGKKTSIDNLKELARNFIDPEIQDDNAPLKLIQELPEIGTVSCNPYHNFKFTFEEGLKHRNYTKVIWQIEEAFNELRNKYAMQYFKRPFSGINKKKRQDIKTMVPYKLAELTW